MRRFLVVLSILIATVSAVASQVPAKPTVSIAIGPVGKKWVAAVGVQSDEVYVGGGSAGTVAQPALSAAKVAVTNFRIRAWKEGDKARVIVYAVLIDDRSPKGETETPISTFTLTLGQSVEVHETTAWGAAPVVVSAIPTPSRP
jgi:hypothetical protein